MNDVTTKCPTCGKFVDVEEAFYTRETDSESSYMVACCNEQCADRYEMKDIWIPCTEETLLAEYDSIPEVE